MKKIIMIFAVIALVFSFGSCGEGAGGGGTSDSYVEFSDFLARLNNGAPNSSVLDNFGLGGNLQYISYNIANISGYKGWVYNQTEGWLALYWVDQNEDAFNKIAEKTREMLSQSIVNSDRNDKADNTTIYAQYGGYQYECELFHYKRDVSESVIIPAGTVFLKFYQTGIYDEYIDILEIAEYYMGYKNISPYLPFFGLGGNSSTINSLMNIQDCNGWFADDDNLAFIWNGQSEATYNVILTRVLTLLKGFNNNVLDLSEAGVMSALYADFEDQNGNLHMCMLFYAAESFVIPGMTMTLPPGTVWLMFTAGESEELSVPGAYELAAVGLSGKSEAIISIIKNNYGYDGWDYFPGDGLYLYWENQDEDTLDYIANDLFEMLGASIDGSNYYNTQDKTILWWVSIYENYQYVCDITLYRNSDNIEVWFTDYNTYPY